MRFAGLAKAVILLFMNESNTPQKFNARLARWLFLVYSLVYLAFVIVCGFAPQLVEWKPVGGVNLAIWWGFGLIGLAFLLSTFYGVLCRKEETGSVTDGEYPVRETTVNGEASE